MSRRPANTNPFIAVDAQSARNRTLTKGRPRRSASSAASSSRMIITTANDDPSAPPFYSREGYTGPEGPETPEKKLPLFPPSVTDVDEHPADHHPSSPSDRLASGSAAQQFDSPPLPYGIVPQYSGSPPPPLGHHTYYAIAPPGFGSALVSQPHPDHPPLSFSRPKMTGLPYGAFKPTFLVARGKGLDKGFPLSPPPSADSPHPFITHDITEVDWLQFLTDLRAAGSLTEKDMRRSKLPIISWVPFVNTLSAYGVQKVMKVMKSDVVVKVVDSWNHHFFEPRQTRIVLMKGLVKLSGKSETPIGDWHIPKPTANMSQLEAAATQSATTSKGKSKDTGDDTYRLFLVPL